MLKFGQIIGFAAADIAAGTLVHNHNIDFREFDRDYAFGADFRPIDFLPEAQRATFQGIVRADGRVATRNYIGILSTVNCSATVVRRIADGSRRAARRLSERRWRRRVQPRLGCGMAMRARARRAERRQWGYARHANLAAALIVGLGCEATRSGASRHTAPEAVTS